MQNESDIVQTARKSAIECDDSTQSLGDFYDDLAPLKLAPCHVTPAEVQREHLINGVTVSLQHGRRITAGLALVELRRSFAREADWLAFVADHLPINIGEIGQLIGAVTFRGAHAVCQQCLTSFKCVCNCGAPYTVERPWAAEPEGGSGAAGPPIMSALDRAVEAVKAHPERSNRALAREIGVDKQTVSTARKALNQQKTVDKQRSPD